MTLSNSVFRIPANPNRLFGHDALSFKMDYFQGDYLGLDANADLESFDGSDGLYNGNIAALQVDIGPLSPLNYRYRYDQLQRLKKMESVDAQGVIGGYRTARHHPLKNEIKTEGAIF